MSDSIDFFRSEAKFFLTKPNFSLLHAHAPNAFRRRKRSWNQAFTQITVKIAACKPISIISSVFPYFGQFVLASFFYNI